MNHARAAKRHLQARIAVHGRGCKSPAPIARTDESPLVIALAIAVKARACRHAVRVYRVSDAVYVIDHTYTAHLWLSTAAGAVLLGTYRRFVPVEAIRDDMAAWQSEWQKLGSTPREDSAHTRPSGTHHGKVEHAVA